MAKDRPISSLILAELYESGDRAFVDRLVEQGGNLQPLKGLVERWKKDTSARARRMKLAFVLDGRLTSSHRMPFKRLFKQAWHDRDHALIGAFLCRMDRSIRRRRVRRHRYENGTYLPTEVLRLVRRGPHGTFSTATTHYLRRRAWHSFDGWGSGSRPPTSAPWRRRWSATPTTTSASARTCSTTGA